ncbi:THO complex subunit 4D [Carex littledalei]|uniref:THO complex subunit 4D n=1 Tax=Carex littledalei TaxID=544730 RepID=A0A833QS82_9POAL|nr:THO complex subunit 4D [Carex littledalei]
MALGNVMRGRREVGRGSRGRGMRGQGRGMARGLGVGTYRGPGAALPPRRHLGVDTRPSSLKIAKSFQRTSDMAWRHYLFEDSMAAVSSHPGAEDGGAKLYISNLDSRVSNGDIKELFSEIGELKRYGVHYDNHGRPNGSAEVVFVRRSDAVAAFKKYNNVQLDGKPMKIELIGSGLPTMPRFNVYANADGRGKRTVVMMPKTSRRGAGPSNRVASGNRRGRGGLPGRMNGNNIGRGRGRGRSSGRSGGSRGRGGRGFWRRVDKSAAELDKELDKYHSAAMDTS